MLGLGSLAWNAYWQARAEQKARRRLLDLLLDETKTATANVASEDA